MLLKAQKKNHCQIRLLCIEELQYLLLRSSTYMSQRTPSTLTDTNVYTLTETRNTTLGKHFISSSKVFFYHMYEVSLITMRRYLLYTLYIASFFSYILHKRVTVYNMHRFFPSKVHTATRCFSPKRSGDLAIIGAFGHTTKWKSGRPGEQRLGFLSVRGGWELFLLLDFLPCFRSWGSP